MTQKNVIVLVMDQRRARLLRVFGRGNGGCQLEAVRISQSLGVKRWLGKGSTNDDNLTADQTEVDPERIRALLREDAVEFVQEIVEELRNLARGGQLHHLIIFAEPQIMRLLRLEFPSSLTDRLLFTHEMSIAHMPEDQLLDKVQKLIDEQE